MYYCHILGHHEAGVMGHFEVVDGEEEAERDGGASSSALVGRSTPVYLAK
jgi:hypothetical protein